MHAIKSIDGKRIGDDRLDQDIAELESTLLE
jgi:hypothetical protein